MLKRPRILVELTVIATIIGSLPLDTATACPWRRCCEVYIVPASHCYWTVPYYESAGVGKGTDQGAYEDSAGGAPADVVEPPRAEAVFQPAPEPEPAPVPEPEPEPAPPGDAPDLFFPPRPRDGAGIERVSPWRDWVDDTGWFQVRARLVQVLGDRVRLLKENGKFATVPLNRLRNSDVNYVVSLWVRSQVSVRLASLPDGRLRLTNARGESMTVWRFQLSAANRQFVDALLAQAAPAEIGRVARR